MTCHFSFQILQNILRWFLDTLPADVVGSTIVEILGSRKFQRKLCETMLEQAFDKDLTGEECILLGDDKWVRVREIFNFKFIKEAISRVLFCFGSFLRLFVGST